MPIINWEYYKHLQHYSLLYGNIFVMLHEGGIDGPSDGEKKQIIDSVLTPLLAMSEIAYLYGKYNDRQVLEVAGTSFPKNRGKLVLTDGDNKSVAALLKEIKEPSERGTLLLEVPLMEELLAPILQNCADPTVMAGLGSCCTKSALGYAKKHFSNEKVFILISQANSGLEWMFLLASKDVLPEIARIVATYCAPSKGYTNMYGPGANLAPLEHKKSYGTGGNE